MSPFSVATATHMSTLLCLKERQTCNKTFWPSRRRSITTCVKTDVHLILQRSILHDFDVRCSTYCLIKVSCQLEFASGTFLQDKAEAFIIKSFTDNFRFSFFRISLSSLLSLKKSKEIIRYSEFSNSKELTAWNMTGFNNCRFIYLL